MTVIILTQDWLGREDLTDPHVISVYDFLNKLGRKCIIFKRFKPDHKIGINLENKKLIISFHTPDEHIFTQKNSFNLWNRSKPLIKSELPTEVGTREQKFSAKQWNSLLRSIGYLPQCNKIINNEVSGHIYSLKLTELELAQKMGLFTSKTLLTNNPDELIKFADKSANGIIYKPFTSLMYENKVLYTNVLTKKKILDNLDSIKIAPGIYQELIDKKYELRIFAVGEKLFVVKIDSQSFEENKIDWRKNQLVKMYEEGELSNKTHKALLSFHKKANLIYAAYDFIVDKNDKEIFLECNPGGQWLFVGRDIGEKISQAMAEELAKN